MGWFKERAIDFIRTRSDGLSEVAATEKLINDALQHIPEFYELEPAEVLSVYLEEQDLPYIPETGERDWSVYGSIMARMLVSSKRPMIFNEEDMEDATLESDTSVLVARPHETNIKEYPYPGEIVIIVDYLGEKYYTRKLNILNSVNNNSDPGMSTRVDWTTSNEKKSVELVTKNFRPNANIKQILASEGDITFNGRYGQSIRFGSNNTQAFDAEGERTEFTENDNEPNIIIRAGQGLISRSPSQPVPEDINADGSSIWMTTDQVVPLIHHKSQIGEVDPKFQTDSSGKQIVLTSDRLVFNSRKNTFLYSDNDINLVSKRRIVLEGHENVYLGSAPQYGNKTGQWRNNTSTNIMGPDANIQPVLLGDQTMKIIEQLMNAIGEFADTVKGTKTTAWGIPLPLDFLMPGCEALSQHCKSAIKGLDDAKSEKVHVSKI
jgi:hypothetical protein